MAKRLTITELSSVGGVDDGDNPGAALLFWKRRKKNTPDAGATVEGVLMDGQTVAVEETEIGKAEPEVAAEVEDVGKVEAEAEAESAETAVEVDDLAKRALEEVEKLRVERDAAVAQLAEEVDKRLNLEWVGKAKAYELLLGPASEVGPLFRKINEAAPDAYQRLEQALAVALNRADLAKIFAEVGKDAGESGTAEERRDRWVKDFLAKNPGKTAAQARAMFWQSHPEAVQSSREGS